MRIWLVTAAVLPLIAATGAQAQIKGFVTNDVARIATTRALDLRLSQELGNQRPTPLMRGMLIHQEVAPNAIVGLGLANIYAKRKSGAEWRVVEPRVRSRTPAVTFVFKF